MTTKDRSIALRSDEVRAMLSGRKTQLRRVKTRLPERFGQQCRVLAVGRLNAVLIEFEDGLRVVTSRYYVRRLQKGGVA